MSNEFYWIAVVAVTVLSTARITRLLTKDKFPPIKALRDWYEEKTEPSGWEWLTICAYCMAPWVAIFVIGTGLWAGVYTASADAHDTGASIDSLAEVWWLLNGWFAVSYLAATYNAYDGSPGDE